jgi:hypothetical protein
MYKNVIKTSVNGGYHQGRYKYVAVKPKIHIQEERERILAVAANPGLFLPYVRFP